MLVVDWVAVTVGCIATAHILNDWNKGAKRAKLVNVFQNPLNWLHEVSQIFITLFDRIYIVRNYSINHSVWTAILLSYCIFIISRFFLWISGIPVPSTQLILSAVLLVSLIAALVTLAVIEFFKILNDFIKSNAEISLSLLYEKRILGIILLGMSAIFIGVICGSFSFQFMGINQQTIITFAMGSGVGLPVLIVVSLIPSNIYPISAVRSFISSIIFLVVLSIIFPNATESFYISIKRLWDTDPGSLLVSVKEGNVSWLGPIFLIIYNLFADAISLKQTRWILKKSLNSKMLSIIILLILDLMLSGLIYIMLPLIAGQNMSDLWEAIFFDGPKPYLGLFFWSTFSTSFIFYLFVFSAFSLALLEPIFVLLRKLDPFFKLNENPIRGAAILLVLIETIGFIIYAIV